MKKISSVFVLLLLSVLAMAHQGPRQLPQRLEDILAAYNEWQVLDAAKENDMDKMQVALASPFVQQAINAQEKEGAQLSALMHAVHHGNLPMVQSLLEKGADANQKDGQGKSVLHHAVMQSNPYVINTILKKSDLSAPANLKVLHEMVLANRQDSNYKFIRAYFAIYHKQGQEPRELLQSPFPGMNEDQDVMVLEEELMASNNPNTKAFFDRLKN